MGYTAILGSTRKQVASTSEALMLKNQGYSVFTDDPFNAVELSSQQLSEILSQEQSQAQNTQNVQTTQQTPLQNTLQHGPLEIEQSQAKEQKTFLKKYWLHILIIIAIIILLIITGYIVWPTITEGVANIRTVPHL